MDDNGPADREAELRAFLLRTCHDLRTPLRAVRANAELLRLPEKLHGPDAGQILGFIVDGATRMDALVEGLAGYTLALHTATHSFLPVRLGVVLRSAMAKLAADIRETSAEITYGELPRVDGDPDRLAQVFEHLLRTAIQARGSVTPRIQVTATARDGAWVIGVKDNGVGLDPS